VERPTGTGAPRGSTAVCDLLATAHDSRSSLGRAGATLQRPLSVPFQLRLTLARRADALSALGRIFVEEIFRWQRELAREWGIAQSRSGRRAIPAAIWRKPQSERAPSCFGAF